MELSSYSDRIKRNLINKLEFYQTNLEKYTEEYLTSLINERISDEQNTIKEISEKLNKNISLYVNNKEMELINTARIFESLNPIKVLARGYTVTESESGKLDAVKNGDILTTISDKLVIKSEVKEVFKNSAL